MNETKFRIVYVHLQATLRFDIDLLDLFSLSQSHSLHKVYLPLAYLSVYLAEVHLFALLPSSFITAWTGSLFTSSSFTICFMDSRD